jgi:hypothetical protein
MTIDTELMLHNIAYKVSVCYGCKILIISYSRAQKLEAAQIIFLRPLLGRTRQTAREILTSVTD